MYLCQPSSLQVSLESKSLLHFVKVKYTLKHSKETAQKSKDNGSESQGRQTAGTGKMQITVMRGDLY